MTSTGGGRGGSGAGATSAGSRLRRNGGVLRPSARSAERVRNGASGMGQFLLFQPCFTRQRDRWFIWHKNGFELSSLLKAHSLELVNWGIYEVT